MISPHGAPDRGAGPGGHPIGAITCDYYFDNSAPDLEVMKGLAKIGAAAHAPIIAAAAPSLLGMESWTELSNPRDLGKVRVLNETRARACTAI